MPAYSAIDTESDMYSDTTSANMSSSLMLYTLLPSLVQRRLSKLRSLGRILLHHEHSARHSRSSSRGSTGSTTPPPSYRSDIDALELFDDAATAYRASSIGNLPTGPPSSCSTTPVDESRSGVRWRYAEPGLALLSLSRSEAQAMSTASKFIRRQYIDGVAYVLRGLPMDLTREEELSLQEAMPAELKSKVSIETHPECAHMLSVGSHIQRSNNMSAMKQTSTLQQCVAAATLYLFLAASFLLPYIQLLFQQAYHFDRKYKISDRLIAQSVLLADMLSKRTIAMALQICAMNDGKVGQSFRDIALYVVQGLSAGVYDGVGEGMHVLGLRADDNNNHGAWRREYW